MWIVALVFSWMTGWMAGWNIRTTRDFDLISNALWSEWEKFFFCWNRLSFVRSFVRSLLFFSLSGSFIGTFHLIFDSCFCRCSPVAINIVIQIKLKKVRTEHKSNLIDDLSLEKSLIFDLMYSRDTCRRLETKTSENFEWSRHRKFAVRIRHTKVGRSATIKLKSYSSTYPSANLPQQQQQQD